MQDTVTGALGAERAAPGERAEAVAALARSCGAEAEAVWRAARLKVASVVLGAPALPPGATWRDLILRAATAEGREEAEEAWEGAGAQPHIPAERLDHYVRRALRLLTGAPDAPHTRHGLLSAAEAEEVISAGSGPVRPLPGRRFHELFEERVRRHPDAVAVVHGPATRTYREINEDANKIAWALHRRGLRPEDVVAVVTERTPHWLAAVLAVFKAGGCYLPLEPRFPAGRMARTLTRAECRWVLADRDVPPLDEALDGRDGVHRMDVTEVIDADGPRHDPDLPVAGDQLAYVYFTSGSTGEPKGALCEHDGFLNHLYAKIEDLGVQEGDTVAQTAPQCFDISLWQLVSPLLLGGRTLLVEQEAVLDVRRFVDLLARHRVQVAQVVPTYLELLLAETPDGRAALPDLRVMAVTGEALKKELVRRWFAAFPGVPLVNCYGLTEVSDDSNHGVMHALPGHRSIPLGDTIRNCRVYVMDEQLHLVPIGAPGEIVMAGVCVGRGYVNDPDRTAAVYGHDPYRPTDRLYRSGDFGRRLPSGDFEYLGRRDSQVKISGFRIEIGEIEDRLLQVPGVRDGAVVVAGTQDDPQLVAYYTGEDAPDGDGVARALGAALPDYMVPPRLYHTRELPLSGNGKIDKIALTARAGHDRDTGGADVAGTGTPRLATDTERRVVALWARLLKVPEERIGRDSRFAELGGTSLSAIRLSIALDRLVTVADLKDTPTVADVAALLDRASATAGEGAPADPAPPAPAPAPVPAAPAPLRVLDARGGPDPAGRAAAHRGAARAALAESGAVMLRGLGVRTPGDVADVAAALGIAAMTEREGFAPRTAHAPGVYSGSHWPADEPMCMHHELSYAATVPGTLIFGCLTAPGSGGRTTVADSQRVLAALPPGLIAPFERHGWLLRRMYHDVGVAWADAFGTADRSAVDAYCAAAGIEHAWLSDDRLATRQRRTAVVRHPRTGAPGWFNQVAFLNGLTMDPAVRDYLTDVYGPDGLPFDTSAGDGTPVTAATVDGINAVYDRFTVGEPWQEGDVLLVDNIRTAHAREPYEGRRDIAVVLGDPTELPGHVLPVSDGEHP
ncbi:amino acid adenylation domain-containing protein [Streptomyces malaysiensis subsp. malaysiensis]|uniref:non-ribosomal peptide synthetase family protein n=1 Tax=Streptomyces malaysiensis TaxID=92644 RepID=UPI0024C0B310|nr:amino acid adenylation domain-containing protein [Streptomyces sp. NA07423]WHX16330.1 amino acid adenylation domain-containing protein [Streptomyces sp. NA07423]